MEELFVMGRSREYVCVGGLKYSAAAFSCLECLISGF
jgi:hypothetical protein